MEEEIKGMGLRGMNLSDKHLFWDITRAWYMVKLFNINKRMVHPLTTESEKSDLILKRIEIENKTEEIDRNMAEIEDKFKTLYKENIF